ncbi:hypothetical protein D3C81_736950 [compost metagenome]
MGINQCVDNLRFGFSHDTFRETLAVPWSTVGQECPAESIRAVLFNDIPRIDNITFGFGHLLPIFIQNMTSGNYSFIRSLTCKQGGDR